MIRFLMKGLWRDTNRSILPVGVIAIGVFLTVFLSAWFAGMFGDMVDVNANFSTGHVKVTSQAYAELMDQRPNDLALMHKDEWQDTLNKQFPEMEWVERIYFGGLLDIPDKQGETRAQGPATGQAVDLLSQNTKEPERLNIQESLVKGTLPKARGQALVSHDFAQRFQLAVGDEVTVFSSTMYGSMTFANFTVAGTVRFGNAALDKGAVIIDIQDARQMLDMQGAVSELLGYFRTGTYNDEEATRIKQQFNARYQKANDEFSPQMLQLKDQNGLDEYLALADSMSGIMISFFVLAMSVVLWNTGLIGGLRRYGEFGIRLALGEDKRHIYRTLLQEGVFIGLIGSVLGTALGLAGAWYLQQHGLDMGSAVESGSMMMPSEFRAVIRPQAFFIGFIPGLFSVVLGNALSGIGIYKRETATLFKQLEV